MNLSLRNLNRCDWYVLIWCLYQMQGLLYPEGIIGQSIQALLIAWAGFEAKEYLLPNRDNPPLLKATSILLIMHCCYGIPLLLFNPNGIETPHVYLQEYLNSLLPIILFYKYLMDGYLSEKRLRIYIFVFLSVAVWHYFSYFNRAAAAAAAKGRVLKETTNNAGYEFLSIMPLTFFYNKKPIIQYSLLCIILLFIVMGMKRGAILIGLICFIWTLYINIKASNSRKQRYATILLGILLVCVGIGYTSYQLANSEYMAKRVEDTKAGDSSARDVIYAKAIDKIVNDTSVKNLLIGRGARATLTEIGAFAHQDWLETAINNGLLGISILMYFCIVFFKTAKKKNDNTPQHVHVAFLMLFFIFLSKTMFSMSIAEIPCNTSILISYCIFYTHHENNSSQISDVFE